MFRERDDMETKMSYYKTRNIPRGQYFDIFDGAMFKEMPSFFDTPLHTQDHALFFTLNADWFQPFENVSYSCGAIYMSINNFPRKERYKLENVILVGLMPGGKEADTTEIFEYLDPLVNELIEFHEGVRIKTKRNPQGVPYYGGLLMTSCDIPASRKVCGFLASSSKFACNKCNTQFDSHEGKSTPNFSRKIATNDWTPRTRESNMVAALRWKEAASLEIRKKVGQEEGCRFSSLQRIPNYDVVRQAVIDPMHNLLLGTCKKMNALWKLDDKDYTLMQKKANLIHIPAGFSDLSGKRIEKRLAGFRADQWKSWCLLYSPSVLTENWILFVQACRLIIKSYTTQNKVDKCHKLLLHSHLSFF